MIQKTIDFGFFVQIVKILDACCDITKFYGTKIMRTKGILNKDRRQTELVGSYKVSIAQTRIKNIFNDLTILFLTM